MGIIKYYTPKGLTMGSERQGLAKMTKSDKNDNICIVIINCYTPKGLTTLHLWDPKQKV
jgi:hypothetical protein